MLPWHEVLGLEFFARTRRKSHAKVRQALVPGTRHAHLLGTIFRRQFCNRVEIASGELRSEKLGSSLKCLSFFDAALDPNFVDAPLLPVRKQAHAISARFDRIKMLFYFAARQVLVNIWGHHKGGLNIGRHLGDRAERPRPNLRSSTFVAT